MLSIVKKVFPPLLATSRKGDNGRIAVIGGSVEFTGAPFYSAISALKIGGDLAHIFCSKSASSSIKSYSP
jgi:ATP-dependent NAD(P)H-hydrate dehydratase